MDYVIFGHKPTRHYAMPLGGDELPALFSDSDGIGKKKEKKDYE